METTLQDRVKKLIIDTLMLQLEPEDLPDEQALFGPGSLGLDSVDALQLVVMLDKNFGLKIPDPKVAQNILARIDTIVAAIEALQRNDPETSQAPAQNQKENHL